MNLFHTFAAHCIAQCTNQRLQILSRATGRKVAPTNAHEIMIAVGSYLTMTHNKVPAVQHYWSSNKTLSNEGIMSVISRDRFQLLSNKLYFNNPQKPKDCGKFYYIEDVVAYFKKTFAKARSERNRQSINESMVKFKGRYSLKQYL
jgi:hypothetical protein